MNQKKCKMLRRSAGYRNQSATPGVMDFPGVSRRFIQVPAYSKVPATKTSYEKVGGRWVKQERQVMSNLHSGDKPVVMLTPAGVPMLDMVAVSMPGRLRAAEPKGTYRALKKLASKYPEMFLRTEYARAREEVTL